MPNLSTDAGVPKYKKSQNKEGKSEDVQVNKVTQLVLLRWTSMPTQLKFNGQDSIVAIKAFPQIIVTTGRKV